MKYLILLLVVNSAFAMLRDDLKSHLWNKFKKAHDKQFHTVELENYRYGIFKANLDLIENHNAEASMGLHTYRLGVNKFADMTPDEFRTVYLGFNTTLARFKGASLTTFKSSPLTVQIPETVDWREQGAVTPVKDQGQCGSCWAFSTTGSLEGAHYRATNKLVSLSEQQLVDCSKKYGNNGCNGGLMDNAFQYVKENGGLDTEDTYPYHMKVEKCHFNKAAIGSLCSGFVDVSQGDENALKEAIALSGPVSVAIDVTENNFMLYKEGVFTDTSCKNTADDLNHGVLVVGYGTENNMDYWIVKNSWSSKWGESGYIRMARNKDNMCGIATAASYPLVKAN